MTFGFTRRDFLKASSAGLLGFFLADLQLETALAAATPKQGRSTISGAEILGEPRFNATKIRKLGRDEVIDIKGEVQGDLGYGNPFNSTWYRVNDGYTYSGLIQPVETVHHKPVFDISESGLLGEITVPFSDTRRAAWLPSSPRRRLP